MLKRVILLFIINLAFSHSYCFAVDDIKKHPSINNAIKTTNSLNNKDRFKDSLLTSDRFNNVLSTYEPSKNEDSEIYALKQNLLVENKESKYLTKQGKSFGKKNYADAKKNSSLFFKQIPNKDLFVITLASEAYGYSGAFTNKNGALQTDTLLNITLIAERYFKKKEESNFRPMIGFSVRWLSDKFAKIYEETVSTTEELGLKRYEGYFGKNTVEFGLRFGVNYQRDTFGVTPYAEAGYGFGSVAMEAINKIEPYTETVTTSRSRHGGYGYYKEQVVVDEEKKKVYGRYFNQFAYSGIGLDFNVASIIRIGLFFRMAQPLNDLVLYNLDKKEINCGKPFIIYGGVMFGVSLPILI